MRSAVKNPGEMEKEDLQPKPPDQTADARKAKRLLARVVFFFLIVNGAILYKVLQKPGPTYQDKTVTHWLADWDFEGEAARNESMSAFGPDAWPDLVRAIQRRDSLLKKLYLKVWQKLSPSPNTRFQRFSPTDAETLRHHAGLWLMELGPDAKEAVPELIELALRAKDLEVRSAAVNLLGYVGLESPEALSTLIDVLRHPEIVANGTPALHHTTCFAVARFGARARVAVPALVQQLRDPATQDNALRALPEIGSEAVEAVPALLRFLEESGPSTWKPAVALQTLMKIGPPARPALPLLRAIESQKTGNLKMLAAIAISRIENQPEPAVKVLSEMLRQPGGSSERGPIRVRSLRPAFPGFVAFGTREAAAWFLGELGPDAKDAASLLAQMAKDGNARFQKLAARAMWRITGDEMPAVSILTQGISQNDEPMFHLALATFEEMGAKARGAGPSLVNFVEDKKNRWSGRREALKVLRKVDPDAAARVSLR